MKNKRYAIYSLADGMVVQFIDIPGDIDPTPLVHEGMSFLEIQEDSGIEEPHKWRVVSDELVAQDDAVVSKMTETRRWMAFNADPAVMDFVQAVSLKTIYEEVDNAIMGQRARLSVEPVEVQEGVFDADSVAIRNISYKLQEVQATKSIGTTMNLDQLVWRDYANTTHVFASQDALENFLQRLTIAIASRSTTLYQWAWTKKELLRQCISREAVLDFVEREGIVLT